MRTRLLLLCICIGSYFYCIAQTPVNDPCIAAIPITTLDGTCTLGIDNTNATPDMAASGCTVGSNQNVWFSFVADGVSAEIIVSNALGTPEITVWQFPTTPCNSGDAIEIDCSTGSPLIMDNLLVDGNTYYVMVAFSNDPDGLFDICIDNPNPAPNDACSTAQPIANLDDACAIYNNNFPSTDVLIPSCFAGATYNVWFSFVAVGVSLDLNISPGGPGIAQFAVVDFTGANCASTGAVVLGCETGTNHIILDNQLTIGTTYHILVGFQNTNFNGQGIGDFELCIDNPIPAVNDDCLDAITIPTNVLDDPTTCFTSISGNPLNNDWPSTDINLGVPACWDLNFTYSIWYSFVAQGNDVEILVDPVANVGVQVALVQFTGAPCVSAGAGVLACSTGTVLDFNDNLVIGNTYYIMVGFENNSVGDFCMNVFNPEPPPNDDPCDAIVLPTNGNCVDGTTVYANPELLGLPPVCQNAISNTVWYTITMADPDNVGYEIDLSLDDVNPMTTVSLVLWEAADCNGISSPAFFYCGAPPTEPIEFGPVDETATYFVMVGTSEPNETDFEICVDEIPPCFTNDECPEATVILDVESDMPFVCVDGCNLFADPEGFTNGCEVGSFSTVWFQVNTDPQATLMNIQVNSTEFDAPTISLFLSIGGCGALQPVGLTANNQLPCVAGSGGEASALGTPIGANQTYYILVSSLNSVGGNFEICVNTISQSSACVLNSQIVITSRSEPGPLTGPFLPGETIGICMNVNSYTSAGNNCQWFQGLVPTFGNGWDPSSFDGDGMPLNASLNGDPFDPNADGIYGASVWAWFNDVGYHHPSTFFQIGDLDGNGTVEMCNILYDPDCPNLGGLVGGGGPGPCWNPSGDILPPGWFAWGINGLCPTPGHPSVDYGDGGCCGCSMGPWQFCFELIAREYPDCLEDPTTMDLSLGFFTFADGEIGSWNGGPSVCALDQPLALTLPMCCTELEEDMEELDPICSGQVIVYVIDKPGVDFWTWTASSGTVTGATSGQGGPGSILINTLTNNGSDPELVEYTFLGFAGGACPVFIHEVTVEVFPGIDATLDPVVLCATPTTPYEITPNVTGGDDPNYFYMWSPGGETTPSIMIPNPVNGTQYTVTVTDNIGCFDTAVMTISVYETFPVDIVAPVVEQCIQLGPIDLTATASGGMGAYDFLWTLPGGGNTPGDQISTEETGEHLVVVTDEEGCVGKDSIDITFNETPEVIINAVNGILAICEGESTTLNGIASLGEAPYLYEWDTPEGLESGKTITASYPGLYTVTVEDANGCTNSADVEIEAQPQPDPDLGPDLEACPDFSDPIELSVTESFEDYQWSIGPSGDGNQTIEVYNPGTYTVTVTNDVGCTGETDVTINLYPQPVFNMPDTFEVCPGNSLTLDSDDYGGPWDITQWSECGACFNLITITSPGDHDVTVYDDNGCTAEQSFSVVETVTLSANLQGDDVICSGETSTLTSDPGFAYYTWFPNPGGSTSNTLNVTTPGTYNLTVEDASGCTGTDMIVITSGDFTASITGPASICADVQTTIDAGAGYTSYLWDDNTTAQTRLVEEGTYSVTVTSADGCTSSASITIVETPFVPVITGDNMICQTSETSTLDAGGPYMNYQWSANAGSSTNQTVVVSTPGTYSVTVTDLIGCVGSASFNVANHPVPFVAVTGLPDFCVGGNTQLSATTGYVSYVWNPNVGSTESITVNAAGNYAVTITDVNGCTNTASMVVNAPYQETVDITGSFVFCPGDQATLAVPTGYASVLWSTGETADTIYVSTEGTISVTVVDTDGCIATDAVDTDENATLSPTITGDAAICDNGTAVLNAGPGFDIYAWSVPPGGNTSTISVNAPGTYTVTVSSLSGCVGTDDFTVTGYTSPFAIVTPDATACSVQEPGGPTTSINFNSLITGGDTGGTWVQVSGPSNVNLSNLTNVNFNGLTAGTYTFSYTTNSATPPCEEATYTMTATITDCACPTVAIGLAPDLCNDLGSIDLNTLILPPTATDGEWAIVAAPPGSDPAVLTGSIFDASTGDPGTYTLSYTISGLPVYCVSSASTTIRVLRTPVAGTAAIPLQFCQGESQNVDLSTLLIGSDPGGIWVESSAVPSTGGAFNPITGRFDIISQVPGTYSFDYIIQGQGPCPDDKVTVEVVIENNPVADAGAPATLDCNQSSTILGGSGSSTGIDFTYVWTTVGGNIINPNQLNATATRAGVYTLTVMNINTGCSASDDVVIDQIGDFPTDMELFVQSPDCEGDPPGNAQVSFVTGGVAPYTYSLNGQPPVSSPVFSNLAAGEYEILVTDATGCKLTDSFTIEELVEVDLAIVNFVNDTFIFDLFDTIRLAYIYSGSSSTPDSLVWKLNDSVVCVNCPELALEAILAGKITLEAYDIRGCFISKSITYLVVRNRDIYVPNVFSPNGDGTNDEFTLYTKSDARIALMEIYTRWGDLVFQRLNFDANDPALGWNGKFRDEFLNPGVYVYRIEIVYGDGLKEHLSGDVTIVR